MWFLLPRQRHLPGVVSRVRPILFDLLDGRPLGSSLIRWVSGVQFQLTLVSGLKWRFLLLLLALLAPCHRIGSAGSLSLCLLLFLMVQVYGSSRSGCMARASYCVASFQTKGTGQEEYVSTRPVTQDSSRYVGRPGCSCAAQQGSSQAGLNILLSARAFSSICTCLPRSDAPGNLQLFLWQFYQGKAM